MLVAAGAMGMVATGGGLWAVADGGDTTAAPVSGQGSVAGLAGSAGAGNGYSTTTEQSGASKAERPVSYLNLLQGKKTHSHMSDGMSVSTGGSQTSCIRGDAWTMTATFTVKNVTRTSAHIVKIVTRYTAPIRSKNVYLGAQNLWQDNGKHIPVNDVGNIMMVAGGKSLKQTINVNKTMKFNGGYAVFQRRASVAQGTGEGAWCGGPTAMEIRFRPKG
ncbi:hypothetical protein ACGFNU_32975 [Spirillospora sp. NPDC048911]|uniref:hypothetical protein n=1 Tax=Spirillospora sp. NPDC048911 TaxID=3364527 RepID=UPI003719CECC